MLVAKKNGNLRLVRDYRQLDKQIIKSCWPFPSIEETFGTLEGIDFLPLLIVDGFLPAPNG